MPTRKLMMSAAIASLMAASPAMAEDPMIVSVKRLSLATAQRIAQGAIDACREKGIQIGVTVVDRDGVIQTQLRDTIAPPITVPISYKKAYTAANLNAPSSARADAALDRLDFLMLLAGGLPIQVGGALVGGVGVSGSPGSDVDEQCAQAGIDAVQDDLEMAM
jgi:uncharacterized protein GlcG (DUF336 family)